VRRRCDETGALLVVDAIFTALGRLGEMWPGADVADVLCVGKSLGGGLPLSAALFVRRGLEDVWRLGVEDVYTHTHSGNALACAAALVVLEEVPPLLPRVAELSQRFDDWRGKGLLRVRDGDGTRAQQEGVLMIPVGDLIQAAPPFTITDDELDEAFARLSR
jgi:adenosylmethionine-8-amino-7-oxononanoate aminotransferase